MCAFLDFLSGEGKPGITSDWVSIGKDDVQLPITIIRGTEAGETFLITAGIHGDEYPGISACAALLDRIAPEHVRGTIIMVHAANIHGFLSRSPAYVPSDRKNLNHAFPGNPKGSETERIAAFIAKNLHKHAQYYVDLHSGSMHEALAPHLYYPASSEPAVLAQSLKLAACCAVPYAVASTFTKGSYGYAAHAGCPGLLLERGQHGMNAKADIEGMMDDVLRMLFETGMYTVSPPPNPVQQMRIASFDAPSVEQTGCWYPAYNAGDIVEAGALLGEVRDVFGVTLSTYTAKRRGVVLYQIGTLIAMEGETLMTLGHIEAQ